MKRLIYLFLLLVGVIASSCSNYLDKLPENKYNNMNIDYTNLSNMYEPVSGVYRTACGENPGLVHWMDFGIRGVRGDDLDKGSSASDQSTLTDIKYFHNSYASVQTFWGTNNCWNDYYGLVIYTNNALAELAKFAANISTSDATNLKLYNQYQAEVRFIRAFAHLTISRIFGNVPILTDNSTLSGIGKSSFADVRKFIMSEMDFCIANLEDARPNQSAHVGAVTKYSALLLKAKAAADLAGSDNANANWDIVLDCTNQIINSSKFSLYSDFYQLFKKPGKLCNESLFELQFSDFGTGSGTNVEPGAFWAFQGPRGDQRGSAISGWGFMTPSQAIVDFFNTRQDSIRSKTTIMSCGADGNSYVMTPSGDKIWGNSDGLKYFNGKAYLPSSQMNAGRTDYGSNNNVRVLRYADALLLNAEAKIRKGQNGDVPLNLVRNRAKLASITNATLQNVLDERRAEFACEWWGERYNDLLRTGQAATALSAFGFTSGTSDYIPIPQTQIDLDQNLK
ncbi:RagB/SusD family nutrient uptake outer membrane protein [Paludibacter sp.]|uniref:RagB/SusD family nutrient uptake outer membrane protein n=1 Tax=Paludibacter sp. TaxID=1898105 RepID=UPI0013555D23|nr:RagB/SusD family nutrient uptake outer membrane protein [Paludibacter sp.]MTK54174.1 RagB/SusD family nutrient uptake outer membrane protein [Paludibacter sp.]